MRALVPAVLTTALSLGVGLGAAPIGADDPGAAAGGPASGRVELREIAAAPKPLAGRTIVIDPGHQLGNRNFPRQINRQVPAGGFTKPCNTTGTATAAGYPEATFVWRVARLLRTQLRERGATVVMTRSANRDDRWGPCVDARGRAGNRIDADLKLSLHADGSTRGRGFHVIAPTSRRGWTDDIHASSRRLALAVRRALGAAGLPRADYIAGGDGLDFRGDLGTLNLSDVPVVMAELGNMRNARDARLMVRRPGLYATALRRAVLASVR